MFAPPFVPVLLGCLLFVFLPFFTSSFSFEESFFSNHPFPNEAIDGVLDRDARGRTAFRRLHQKITAKINKTRAAPPQVAIIIIHSVPKAEELPAATHTVSVVFVHACRAAPLHTVQFKQEILKESGALLKQGDADAACSNHKTASTNISAMGAK